MSQDGQAVSLESVMVQNDTLLFSDVGDGKTLMDMDTGEYYRYEEVGARIWDLIDGKADVAAICSRLTDEYDVDAETCQRQTLAFLTKLERLGHAKRL